MGLLSENEILDRHKQSLGEAMDHCKWLAKQADELLAEPRGLRYQALQDALKKLEGSARQMAHYREDTRWVKLGILYAKVMRKMQVLYAGQRWIVFGQMVPIFENGMRSLDDLATRKTGKRGPVLPTQPTDWLILPDLKIQQPQPRGLIH